MARLRDGPALFDIMRKMDRDRTEEDRRPTARVAPLALPRQGYNTGIEMARAAARGRGEGFFV